MVCWAKSLNSPRRFPPRSLFLKPTRTYVKVKRLRDAICSPSRGVLEVLRFSSPDIICIYVHPTIYLRLPVFTLLTQLTHNPSRSPPLFSPQTLSSYLCSAFVYHHCRPSRHLLDIFDYETNLTFSLIILFINTQFSQSSAF